MTLAKILLRREQEVDHQLDHLTRGEMLPCLFIRLLGADPDELLEDVTHPDIRLRRCQTWEGEIDCGIAERLDDLIQEVFLRHPRDLLIERESFHDLADVLREA